nr:hypothetical protein CFP56_69762 [Quercus suber]
MAEDRVGRLEGEVNNLTSMVSEQQKVMKEIQEMLAAMHTRSERHTSIQSSERAESSHRHGEGERFSGRFNSGQWGSNGSVIPKLVEVDLDSSSDQIMQHSLDYAAQLLLSLGCSG